MAAIQYPQWSYFPRNTHPPKWVNEFVSVVGAAATQIDTRSEKLSNSLNSDGVLAALRPGLLAKGYLVENGKKAADKIRRPVLFGDNGLASVSYELDAFHPELGIAVEIEAGRGAANNADYRDIVRTSLILDADFLILGMPIRYRFMSGGKVQATRAFENTRGRLEAIYSSNRLQLPFTGVLLVGY